MRRRRRRRGVEIRFDVEDFIEKLEKALRRRSVKPLLGRLGDISLIIKHRAGGRTVAVTHLVISRDARVRHYGLLGLRGWRPGMVAFKYRSVHLEFDLLRGRWRRKPY